MLKKHVNARSWRKEFFAVQAGILHRFRSKKHYVEHTAAAAAYGPHSKQVCAGVCVCVCVCVPMSCSYAHTILVRGFHRR